MEVLQTFKQILNSYIFLRVGNKLASSTSLGSIKSSMARNLSTIVKVEVHRVSRVVRPPIHNYAKRSWKFFGRRNRHQFGVFSNEVFPDT